MSVSKLPRVAALSMMIALISAVPSLAQGISEMGAAHAMGATLGAGLHRNAGGASNGLNNVYGSINKQLGGVSAASGGSGSAAAGSNNAFAFASTDKNGDPIDPRIMVRDAGKESNRLFDLAVQKQKAGKNAEAEQLYRRSLLIRERIWGSKDPAVTKIMGVIAELMRKRGDLAGAEVCYHAVLTTELKHYGAGTYELVPTLEKLGQICFAQKKYSDSYNYFQQVYTQRSRKLGVDSPETITAALELSKAYYESGNFSDAAELLSKTIDAKLNDSGSPQMVKLLEAYMNVLKKQNKQEELTRIETKLQSMKPSPVAAETKTETNKVETVKSETSKTDTIKTEVKSEGKTTEPSTVSIKSVDKVEEVKTVSAEKKINDAGH
jgi:tetratricopeptide (TPR) repeat protein